MVYHGIVPSQMLLLSTMNQYQQRPTAGVPAQSEVPGCRQVCDVFFCFLLFFLPDATFLASILRFLVLGFMLLGLIRGLKVRVYMSLLSFKGRV